MTNAQQNALNKIKTKFHGTVQVNFQPDGKVLNPSGIKLATLRALVQSGHLKAERVGTAQCFDLTLKGSDFLFFNGES